MDRNQQRTGALVRKHIIESLDRASGDDENLDAVQYAVEEAKHPIDTSACDIDLLVNDPKVQAAFKKFVSSMVGTFQQVGGE